MSPICTTERLYDVFGREREGVPVRHLGTVLATDAELARIYASQVYGRRGENRGIVVAERSDLHAGHDYRRVLDAQTLREALGYRRHGLSSAKRGRA